MRSFIFVMRIVNALESWLPAKLDVSALARKLNVSKWHLQHEFKQHTGLSVGQYYRVRLLTLAAKEIAQSQKRLLDIAFDYGFDSQEAFYRAFKRQFNLSPKQIKRHPDIGAYLAYSPLSIEYLCYYAYIQANPPYQEVFPACELHGVAQEFPSISFGVEAFDEVLQALWQRFNQATLGWHEQPRRYFTLEYRNSCSYISGLFQMLAVCDGEALPEALPLTQVRLSERNVWCFSVPNLAAIPHFFVYLNLVFAPNQQLWLQRLPYIWQPQADGSIVCRIEMAPSQEGQLPCALVGLEAVLLTMAARQARLTSTRIPEQFALKSQRLEYALRYFSSYLSQLDGEHLAILIGCQNEKHHLPQHDYHLGLCQLQTGKAVSILPASYLKCSLQGKIEEIGEALDTLYYSHLDETPYYLVPGFEWITCAKPLEDQHWYLEMLIPVRKR